jgi:rhodanese-related sulfurtransferase
MATQAPAIVAAGSISRPDAISVSPRAEPSPPGAQHDITLDQIRTYVRDETAMLMDVRSPEDFARGHVRRAVNLPAGSEKQMDGYLALIRPSIASDQLIILYCYGPKCGSGDMVSEYLADQGFTDLHVYSPGWPTLASAKDLQ